MMSVKLAFGNVKKSIGSFLVYFVTLALGVAMFYAFNALQDQSLFKYFEEAYAQRLSLLFDTLGGLNKFIAFIFGLIILYATSYLLRKRKKEFGLYMILGMDKLKISTILVLETFFIGLFSLAVGIVLGIGLSQLINIFLGHLFVADISRLTLSISMNAIVQTLINFGIIYLVAMVFSVILMNRAKLIDLLKASQQNEKSWWQKPWIGSLLFILGLAVLTWSYYIATHLMDVIIDLQWGPKLILYSIFGGIIGTYFTFMGIAAFIPVILPKFKGFYYRKLHSFGIRQFSTQLAKSVFSLATICLLQFFAIGILVASFNFKNGFEERGLANVPFDFQFSVTQAADENVEGQPALIEKNADEAIARNRAYFKGMKKKEVQYEYYIDPKIDNTIELLGISVEKGLIAPPIIINQTQYNQMAPYYHLAKADVKPGEYAFLMQFNGFSDKAIEDKLMDLPKIKVANQTFTPSQTKFIDGTIQTSGYHTFVILNDADLKQLPLQLAGKVISTVYNAEGKRHEKELAKNWEKMLSKKELHLNYSAQSQYSAKTSLASDSLMVTVVGMYLGIFFLIAAIGILALKSLVDFEKHQQNYRILRQLGASEQMIQKSLFNQVAIFFILPLVGALFHMIFGLKFTKDYMMIGGGYELSLQQTGWVIGFVIMINAIYLMITYLMNRLAVKEI